MSKLKRNRSKNLPSTPFSAKLIGTGLRESEGIPYSSRGKATNRTKPKKRRK